MLSNNFLIEDQRMTKLADDVAFDEKEVTFRDLTQLALLLNVNENEIDDIANSVKD